MIQLCDQEGSEQLVDLLTNDSDFLAICKVVRDYFPGSCIHYSWDFADAPF